jgi:methyl-accepting chemotaxis protein
MTLPPPSIGTRLWCAFGLVTVLLAACVSIALLRMDGARRHVDNILNDRYRKIGLATEVKYDVARIHQHMRGALMAGDAAGVAREAAAMDALRAANKRLLDTFDKLINVPRARDIFTAITQARARDMAGQQELLVLLAARDAEGARRLLAGRIANSEAAYAALLDDMVRLQAGKMDEESAAILAEFEATRRLLLALAAGAVTTALLAAAWATRSITRPMREAVLVARRVAAGDLTERIRVESSDETGQLMQALQDMNDSLARIVGEVRVASDAIATASGQIAGGNDDLAGRTDRQASALQQTASSMEQLTGTVQQTADNAGQANALAAAASEVAVRGGQVVSQVVDTMGSITASARRIADITGVIDGLAFQTNILALNAAVEAARAGAHGRGFAVVAAEVRTLAQRSAVAAREIKDLIGESVAQVESGRELAHRAGTAMHDIVASVQRVTDIIGEITAAIHEQTAGIGQINQAIGDMDGVTQQNASLVEEAAAASQSLRELAGRLVRLVGVFRLEAARG